VAAAELSWLGRESSGLFMTASRYDLLKENERMRQDLHERTFQLVRLLNYVINMQEDHPDLGWDDLPDRYDEVIWRYVT
jgi:hypothetical protein